ncbi:uncharacterized protein BCR38DRAFT_406385 [Pseudomassariella vexata]|uniref:Uncharacterized protein n=1 Tax=Pseudomassariella vexata TaxID=1141098 RepID=A0A1Y2EA93_9PEZI|nr:uncharacterized protein BCR38DRAFT_406385 [Pseudomassariella vexata]ORY68462.1 hypothetical protein BCR38DRAFT_406385 [Pseudomassariella vexata]
MCEQHLYSYYRRDGSVKSTERIIHCNKSTYNHVCTKTKEFQHPFGERPPITNHHLGAQTSYMPPSPPTSDLSHSGNESRKRHSAVYGNGHEGFGIKRKLSHREKRANEHFIVGSRPASPITPPRSPLRNHAVPVFPTRHAHIYNSEPGQYVQTARPAVRVEVNESHRSHRTSRHYESHHRSPSQGGSSLSDEERRPRKVKYEIRKTEAVHSQKIQSEIERQNEAIASRPSRPAAPVSPQSLNARRYRRPSVSIKQPDIVDAMRTLHVSQNTIEEVERERRRQLKHDRELQEQQEEEAQRRRLVRRMSRAPRPTDGLRRSATVGPYNTVYRY